MTLNSRVQKQLLIWNSSVYNLQHTYVCKLDNIYCNWKKKKKKRISEWESNWISFWIGFKSIDGFIWMMRPDCARPLLGIFKEKQRMDVTYSSSETCSLSVQLCCLIRSMWNTSNIPSLSLCNPLASLIICYVTVLKRGRGEMSEAHILPDSRCVQQHTLCHRMKSDSAWWTSHVRL